MLVTADTSHADKSWLKECALSNISYMLVTADTSHDPIGPFGPAEQLPTGDSLMHAPTAPWSSVLLRGANAVATPTAKTSRVLLVTVLPGAYFISRLGYVSEGHSPRQKVMVNKNDNKVISTICTLCTHIVVNMA